MTDQQEVQERVRVRIEAFLEVDVPESEAHKIRQELYDAITGDPDDADHGKIVQFRAKIFVDGHLTDDESYPPADISVEAAD